MLSFLLVNQGRLRGRMSKCGKEAMNSLDIFGELQNKGGGITLFDIKHGRLSSFIM